MKHEHPIDRMIDARGRYRSTPGLVVETDTVQELTREGSLCVHGGTYTIAAGATNFGIVVLQPRARLVILGTQNGIVQVHDGASVSLHDGGDIVDLPGGRVDPSTGMPEV